MFCQQEERPEEKLSPQEQCLREEFETSLRAKQQELQVVHQTSMLTTDAVPVNINTMSLSRVVAKPAFYEGKTPWSIYNIHFEVIDEANGSRNREQACCIAASLRSLGADFLQTFAGRVKPRLRTPGFSLGSPLWRQFSTAVACRSAQGQDTETPGIPPGVG